MKIILLVLSITFLISVCFAKDTTTTKKGPITLTAQKTKLSNDTNWWTSSETNGSAILSALISSGLILISVFIARGQWRQDQRWKQRDAMMNRIDDFSVTPGARNAALMLDWEDREIPLKDHSLPECRYERVTRKEVIRALLPPAFSTTPKDTAIRDSFEDILGRLTYASAFLGNDLVEKETFDMLIMNPFIRSLRKLEESQKAIDNALFRRLFLYLDWRSLDDTKRLLYSYNLFTDKRLAEAEIVTQQEIDMQTFDN